jgi:hypothetical protein
MFDFVFYGSDVYFGSYAQLQSKVLRIIFGPNRKRITGE